MFVMYILLKKQSHQVFNWYVVQCLLWWQVTKSYGSAL